MGHYYWAARQCLKLLRPGSGLATVSIEGSSPLDPMAAREQGPDGDSTGEYVVDIAEYYGDATPDAADKSSPVSSTTRRRVPTSPGRRPALGTPWKASGARFSGLGDDSSGLRDRVSFEFVSNRPADDAVIQALSDIGRGPARPAHG